MSIVELIDDWLPTPWVAYGICCACWVWGAATTVALPWMLIDMRTRLDLSSTVLGVIAAAQTGGQVIGYTTLGWLGDAYGRRVCALGCTAALLTSHIATGLCGDKELIAFIVLLSLVKSAAYGGLMLLTKNLVAELIPTARRGSLLNLLHVSWQFGGLFATGMSFVSTDYRRSNPIPAPEPDPNSILSQHLHFDSTAWVTLGPCGASMAPRVTTLDPGGPRQ